MVRHLSLLIACAVMPVANGQALYQSPYSADSSTGTQCAYADTRFCQGPSGLLWILKGASGSWLQATGSLTTAKGVTVTDTRSGSVYCKNASGGLVLLGNNQPCVESQGLRVESASTNSILQSQALGTTWAATGAVVAAPTVTNNTGDVTDPTGGSTATKIVYPAVSGANAESAVTQAWTATAAAWSLSVYLRTSSGTATIWVSTGAAGGAPTVRQSCSVTTTWTRCGPSNATLTAASWTYEIGVDLRDASQTTESAQTVYAWQAQAEAGTYATSPIQTTTTTVARAADFPSVPNPLTGANFCVGATFQQEGGSAWAAQNEILAGGTQAGANSWQGYLTSGQQLELVYDNTDTFKQGLVSGGISFASHRVVMCDQGGTDTIYLDGASQSVTPSGSGTNVLSSQPSTIYLGVRQDSQFQMNGWLSNICADPSSSNCTP